MTDEALVYLASLPKPTIIEELDYEALLAARKVELVSKFADRGIPYDVAGLETDPAIIQIEEATFEEVLLRARGNDIARGRYRLWATGSDLDHLAEFYYGLRRLVGEGDDRLNHRITLEQQGVSVAGPEPYYARLAMAASIRVADVRVWRDPLLPIVNVSVLAADNDGVADDALIALVEAAIATDAVRPMSAVVRVRSAVRTVAAVVADCTLLPDTAPTLLDTLRSGLAAKWAVVGGLGRDLTADWLKAALMSPGMYSVAIQSGPSTVDDHEMVRIGSVHLNLVGRAR